MADPPRIGPTLLHRSGQSKKVPNGSLLKHTPGHEWGHAGWRDKGVIKFFDFGLDAAILDLFDYCPFFKGKVKGIMPTDLFLLKVLGSGKFGEVYLGKLKMRAQKAKSHMIARDAEGYVDCAVKYTGGSRRVLWPWPLDRPCPCPPAPSLDCRQGTECRGSLARAAAAGLAPPPRAHRRFRDRGHRVCQ